MSTLFLICGLPGSGKTTLSKQMERKQRVLRLCPDEWIECLFGVRDHIDNPDLAGKRRAHVEALQWDLAAKTLSLGLDVVLENGFWSRTERDMYRKRAESAGAQMKIIFLGTARDELWARISRRNKEQNAFVTTEEDLDRWLSVFEPPTTDELSQR